MPTFVCRCAATLDPFFVGEQLLTTGHSLATIRQNGEATFGLPAVMFASVGTFFVQEGSLLGASLPQSNPLGTQSPRLAFV